MLIYLDYSRRLLVVDPDDHALFISLGCALKNLIIAANHMGYSAKVECFPPNEEKDCIRVTINKEKVEFDPDLFNAIPNRQATRSKYDGRPIPMEDLEKLKQAGKQDKVSFILFTEEKEIDPIIEFVKKGNVLQFRNKSFVNELIKWIRFSKKDVLASRDGLNSASISTVPNLGTVICSSPRAFVLVRLSGATAFRSTVTGYLSCDNTMPFASICWAWDLT